MLKGLLKPVTILFILAQVLVLVAPAPALAQDSAPEAELPGDVTVLSAEETSALAEIALKTEEHLQLEADGTLTLKVNDPATLDVDQDFLDAYKASLEEINELVRAGELVINDDLTVDWTKELSAEDLGGGEVPPADAQPDWGAYPYTSGVGIYFTPHEARRIHTHGLTYASTISAHLRRPHTSSHFTYLFTRRHNHSVFGRHRYHRGTYFYTPWSYYNGRYYYKNIYFYRYYRYGGGRWVYTRAYY